jgi:hypothetical protein
VRKRGLVAVVLAAACGCQLVAGLTERSAGDSRKSCILGSECATGEECLFRVCSVPCKKDVDCPAGFYCLDTETGSACVSNTQASCAGDGATECPLGTICNDSQCRTSCGDADDCRSDQTCTNDVCIGSDVGPSSGGSTSSGGASSSGGTIQSSGGTESSSGGSSSDGGAGATEAGGSAGSTGNAGNAGSGGTGPTCGALPNDAPSLTTGTWVDLTQTFGKTTNSSLGLGLAMDPCDTKTLYWANSAYVEDNAGVFKTTNAGTTWVQVGSPNLNGVNHIAIDPNDVDHLYATDGTRGDTYGFWVSTDAGETWTQPQGFQDACSDQSLPEGCGMLDVYDMAVNPTDFDHVLLTFGSPWDPSQTSDGAGILESDDGGESWTDRNWPTSTGSDQAINFMYEPTQSIGNSDTWLLGTQSSGIWRTTNGGTQLEQVLEGTDYNIPNAGSSIYYSPNGTLYVGAQPNPIRTTSGGDFWEPVWNQSAHVVFGDGETLYTARAGGSGVVYVSEESDGLDWSAFPSGPTFPNGGLFEMVNDTINGIVYASVREQGVWALKYKP